MIEVRQAGTDEYPQKLKVLLAGGAGVRKLEFARQFPNPIVAASGSNSTELAVLEYKYTDIGSEDDLFQLTQVIEESEFETLILDGLDSFQNVLLDNRLKREHRNELNFDDWKWLEKRLRAIFTKLSTLDVHVVVTTGVKDVQVGNRSVMLPSVQGAFQNQMAQFFTHMLWLRANTTPESGDAPSTQEFYLVTAPVAEAEWCSDFTRTTSGYQDVNFVSDFETLFKALDSRSVQPSLTEVIEDKPQEAEELSTEIPGQINIDEAIAAEENNPNPVNQESVNGGDICESCGATDVPKTWVDLSTLRFGAVHCEDCFKKKN